MTVLAFVAPLARIDWHRFFLRVAAQRARDRRLQDKSAHGDLFELAAVCAWPKRASKIVHPHEMQLEYLLFDFTDDEAGSCSFDSLASVLPARLPALVHEIETVLGWAHREFGAPPAAADEGEWNFDLQAVGEHDVPLEIDYDIERARVSMPPASGRVTLALTISGSPAFGAAFREAFPASE